MTEIKLPAKWLKERGIEVSLMLDTGEFVVVGKDTSGYVRTFGYRQHNTGKQPVPDPAPVKVVFCDGTWRATVHALFSWEKVDRWKPNAEALMEIYIAEQNAINEPKKVTKLKLTKDDIGKEFVNKAGEVDKMVHASNTVTRFCFENNMGSLYLTSASGTPLYDSLDPLFERHSIIKRHELRYWLKDLPDADLCSDDVWSIGFAANMKWYVIDLSGNDHLFPFGNLPKLDVGGRIATQITIKELKEWQLSNSTNKEEHV